MSQAIPVAYGEFRGQLQPSLASGDSDVPNRVVFSNISHGSLARPGAAGVVVRFVGRGTEHYSIGQRYYAVNEDQFMIAPRPLGSEVEIRRTEREGTLGLCIYLGEIGEGLEQFVEAPIVLPAICELGLRLKDALSRLVRPMRPSDVHERIVDESRVILHETILRLEGQIDAVPGLKRRTRFEAVRRLNLARAYLHSVTDRAVPLSELASEAAISQFQLLRSFRDCFGETPAAYHRRLRLNLARELVKKEGLDYASVADRFGFSSGASLSHSHRRTFGNPPIRSLESRRT